MTIGLCRLVLYLPKSGSLKGKRQVIKSLTARIRQKFNVSVAEIGDHDLWQKAEVGVAILANDSRYANQVLSKVVSLVQSEPRVEVIDHSLELI